MACGGSSPPPETPDEQTPATAVAEEKAVPTPEPLAVAEEPADLIAVGRVRTPGPSVDKLGEWAGFPLPWQELLSARFPDLQGVLAPNAPAEFAVSLGVGTKAVPDVYGVFSLPLTDHDRGVSALKTLGEPTSADDDGRPYVSLSGNTECTVARANGPSPARLVCGNHESLLQLTAFAASNLPQQAIGNDDLYAELRLRPIHARYAKRAPLIKMLAPMLLREASLQNPRFDAALADLAHGVTDDLLILVNEVDKLTLKLDLDQPTEQVTTELGFVFRGQKSFLPAWTAHAAQHAGAAPAAFWNLPQAISNGGFSTSSEQFPRLQGMFETLGELAGGGLEYAGLASGTVDAWLTDFKAVLNTGGSMVSGHLEPANKGAAQTLTGKMGCELVALDADNGALVRWLDSSAKLANDAKLRAELTKRFGAEFKRLPTVSVKAAPARYGLPAGSKVYSVKLTAEQAQRFARNYFAPDQIKKAGGVTLTLVVAQQGATTWTGWGADEAWIAASMKQVLSGNGGLANNPNYARWRTARVASASTLRIMDFIEPSFFSGEHWLSREDIEQFRRAMPHQGESAFHMEFTANSEGPTGATRVVVPRAAVEDIAALIVAAMTKAPPPAEPEAEPEPEGTVSGPVGIKRR